MLHWPNNLGSTVCTRQFLSVDQKFKEILSYVLHTDIYLGSKYVWFSLVTAIPFLKKLS